MSQGLGDVIFEKRKLNGRGWGIVNEGGGYRGRDGGMLLNMEEREDGVEGNRGIFKQGGNCFDLYP